MKSWVPSEGHPCGWGKAVSEREQVPQVAYCMAWVWLLSPPSSLPGKKWSSDKRCQSASVRGESRRQEQEDIHSEGETRGKQSLLTARPMGKCTKGVQKESRKK